MRGIAARSVSMTRDDQSDGSSATDPEMPLLIPAEPRAPQPLAPATLAGMSKAQRRAYHESRRWAAAATDSDGDRACRRGARLLATKAERRKLQETQRSAKICTSAAIVANDDVIVGSALWHRCGEAEVAAFFSGQGLVLHSEPQPASEGAELEDSEDEDGCGDLLSTVRAWMREHRHGSEPAFADDLLYDLNMRLRCEDHTDKTVADILQAMLQVLFLDACDELNLTGPRLQPVLVKSRMGPLVGRWAAVLGRLYGRIGDARFVADIVCRAACEGAAEAMSAVGASLAGGACAEVGFLMAVLERTDGLEEAELLSCLRRRLFLPPPTMPPPPGHGNGGSSEVEGAVTPPLPPPPGRRSPVMEHFVAFLEESLAAESSPSEEDDAEGAG